MLVFGAIMALFKVKAGLALWEKNRNGGGGSRAGPSNFLDASLHMYKRVCQYVGPSVGTSVRRSVCP